MNICIPIKDDSGLQSKVFAHFGTTPRFLIVDTETRRCHAVENPRRRRPHGRCWPMEAFSGEKVSAFLVRSIGAGALHKLRSEGIEVYQTEAGTVEEALAAFQAGILAPAKPEDDARGHHHHHHHERCHGGHEDGGCHGRGRRMRHRHHACSQ